MPSNLQNLERAAELEAKGDWGTMLAFARAWALEEPNSHFAVQAIGDALRNQGHPAEAIRCYLKALELAPSEPVPFLGQTATVGPLWYRLAQAYSNAARLQEAIEALHKSAEIDPTVTAIWNELGLAYTKTNNYKAAFTAFKKAVSIDPSNTVSLKNLGYVYAVFGLGDGVAQIHHMLAQIDNAVAIEFITHAREVLAKE